MRRDFLTFNETLNQLKAGSAKLWMLLVGVNQYQKPWNSLEYAVADCQGLKDALEKATEEFKSREFFVHHDGANLPPTLEAVRNSLQKIESNAHSLDIILFYFAGHGKIVKGSQEPFLCLADTQKERLSNTGLALDEVLQQFRNCSACQQLVLLDACYSGSITTALGKAREEVAELTEAEELEKNEPNPILGLARALEEQAAQRRGFCAILSCDKDQISWEYPELKHGVFTYYLIQGFQGKAADAKGVIKAISLSEFVQDQTRLWVTRNKKGIEQTPVLFTSTFEPIVLGLVTPDYSTYSYGEGCSEYRKAVEQAIWRQTSLKKAIEDIQSIEDIIAQESRQVLQELSQQLGLTKRSVKETEQDITQIYKELLIAYKQETIHLLEQQYPLTYEALQQLQQSQQRLGINREIATAIRKRLTQAYEQKSWRYREEFRMALYQRGLPPDEAHQQLQELQQELELSTARVEFIEAEVLVNYGLNLSITPVTVSRDPVTVGGELEFTLYLKRNQTDENNTSVQFSLSCSTSSLEKMRENFYSTGLAIADKYPAYILEIPCTETIGRELNIILNAPGFQLDDDNTASLPLDSNTSQITQTARFRLTALRSGTATITAELYRGDIFETTLETKVQVTGFDEANFTKTRITTQPRPVPQPDFILKVQTLWNQTNSACRFQYQLRSFRISSRFPGETNYLSESLSSSWLEQMRGLLETTLENLSEALPEDGRSHLTSLGQYLFQHLIPTELQSDFLYLIPQDRIFSLLILADQDASLPWELLYDGQRFFSDRFIIGRWFWELNNSRPYEFPVGAINVAYYNNVEQPELWTALLEPPGSPPPLPLPEGVLGNLDSTEAMRGLHLIRYSQSSDAANRRNAPVTLDDTNNAQDIERQMRPAKLNLRRHRPLVSLGYIRRDLPELTTIEQTWASAFIRAGCSAFIGSLWAVNPAVEAAFISGFYNHLWTSNSLGEAFHASRQLARAAAPNSLDWLAYVLFGDPMARPYRPVEGQGYAVVEPIGQEIDEPVPPGATVRFRVSLRRTPPVWYENRLMEVAEELAFEDLQVFIVTSGLEVTPADSVEMRRTPTGDYLGWFSLSVPQQMESQSVLVQVFFEDDMEPVHSLRFQLKVSKQDGEGQ